MLCRGSPRSGTLPWVIQGQGELLHGLPFCGKRPWGSRGIRVELLMNFWGGLRICLCVYMGLGDYLCQGLFGSSSSLSWERRNSIREEFGGLAAGLVGRAGYFLVLASILCSLQLERN